MKGQTQGWKKRRREKTGCKKKENRGIERKKRYL